MDGVRSRLAWLHALVAMPPILALILAIDVAAYFGGLLYWYGYVMAQPETPWWAWAFIPDCPLFGLLGGLGILIVVARDRWTDGGQEKAQRVLLGIGGVSAVLWLSTYLPAAPNWWAMQGAMLAVWSWALLLCGALLRRAPVWLLGLIAFGQIKYGIWTITAWLLFWRNTAAVYGAPLFTFDSIFMTITHIGLVAQGILLLTYFRPTLLAAGVSFLWFGASDYVDYGLGFYPAIPEEFIPLGVMQWSTVTVTVLLSALYAWVGLQAQDDKRKQPVLKERGAGD